MDKYEAFAVGHYLTCWPENFSYLEVIKALEEDDQEVELTVYETYELYPVADIAHFITWMVRDLRKAFP